jgi:hypothetical protein
VYVYESVHHNYCISESTVQPLKQEVQDDLCWNFRIINGGEKPSTNRVVVPRLHRPEESIPWNIFLWLLISLKITALSCNPFLFSSRFAPIQDEEATVVCYRQCC